MKRKEKKLKSKFGRSYKYRWIESCQWLMKYDRKFVERYYGDVRHLPFSRGNTGDFNSSWYKGEMRKYIKKFLAKRVGMDADMVFHQFSKLGWRNSYDMYHIWCSFVDPEYQFHVSEEGVLMPNSPDDYDSKLCEESEESPISEQLNHSQMHHNSNVKVPKIHRCELCLWKGVYAGRMGKFYVEYEGRVILCNVYHIVHRDARHWNLVKKDYCKVSILGLKRNERSFHDCTWYGCHEKLEDIMYSYWNGMRCMIGYHDLYPYVKIEEVRQLLRKAVP